ncbi:hypothetical protein [Actinomadura verrucosospora]|uniref:Uncharacterized protein n=1 Tax=Actinomadura verrucosospora TaxID=46165 RepID=A0A7D3VZ06_ACTVE|nr:hypothetical protein [Actinomadura verrucosospora]QKG24554.1 hypothetical protein ACTIVE_6201 [Actinomadura verrucosospora]
MWLFMQVLMPFATRVITADGAFPPRFGLYALLQVLASASFALIILEIRRERLYRADVPPPVLAQSLVRGICLAAVFGVSVPVAFLTASTGAYLCWLSAPIVLAVARRVQSRPPSAKNPPQAERTGRRLRRRRGQVAGLRRHASRTGSGSE